MKWIIFTNDNSIIDSVSKELVAQDKKNKVITCDFELENLLIHKKEMKDYAGCIIYSDKEDILSGDLKTILSSIYGFLASDKVAVLTNLNFLINNAYFSVDGLIGCKDCDAIINYINKHYDSLSKESIKRLSKKKLLDKGIPFTPDCFATYIAKNKLAIVKEFLKAEMSINSKDDMGVPMLNVACRNDNFEFVEMFLKLGAKINAVSDDRGYTAVMDAVWRGNEKITKFLIEKGADLNTINKEGQTNLILAVGANRESLVQLLAENGADPDVKDMMGMSAYTYAVLFKKEKLVEILKPYHKE